MKQKRLKLFIYDLAIYFDEVNISENFLSFINSYIRNCKTEETVKRLSLIFDVTKKEDSYNIKYKNEEIINACEALKKESIENIIKDIKEEEIFEIGYLASDIINYMIMNMMKLSTNNNNYTRKLLN